VLFLPLIQRELGLRARRAGSYWGRFAVGGLAVLTCLPALLSPGFATSSNAIGTGVFNTLVAMAFVLCCVACILTADVVGSEKREGTLGLLLLTRVKRFDVILGKLLTNGVTGIVSLFTLMPFLMIPVLAGGVTGGEAWRKAVALLNALFLALAVGIYSSSCVAERLKATRKAALWLVSIIFLPVLAHGVMLSHNPTAPLVAAFSPLRAVIEAGDSHYRALHWPYWIGLGIVQAVGWAFLIGAGARMQMMVREEPQPRKKPPLPREVPLHSIPSRSGWRSAIYSPVEWLVRRQRGLKGILWFGVFVGIIYYVLFRAFSPWRAFGMGSTFWLIGYWVPNVLVGSLSGAFFAWAASRFFIETRRNGELELLLTTPVGARTIVRDQWKVLHEALLFPLVVSVVALLLPFVFTIFIGFGNRGGMEVVLPYFISIVFSVFNMVLGILALCRVGLWFGMKAQGQASAIIWTLGFVKGVPYLITFGWSLLTALLGYPFRSIGSPFYLLSFLPSIAILIFYIWIINAAKRFVVMELVGANARFAHLGAPFLRAKENATNFLARIRSWNTT